MQLNSDNLDKMEYRTKKVKLKKAKDIDINVALLPGSVLDDSTKMSEEDFTFLLLSKTVVDEKGEPVFKTNKEFEKLPLAIRSEILEAIYEYNGMTSTAIDDAVKN